MMVYQRLFGEYSQIASQILMTKSTMVNTVSRENAKNCFDELFRMGIIPIVNENDTISTHEMQFGDKMCIRDRFKRKPVRRCFRWRHYGSKSSQSK